MNISLIPNTPQPTIRCSQNDTGLRMWKFNLVDEDIVTPQGDVSLICSNGVEIPLTKSVNDLYCDCTAQLSAKSGKFFCKIKMVNGDEIIHSALFVLIVEEKP